MLPSLIRAIHGFIVSDYPFGIWKESKILSFRQAAFRTCGWRQSQEIYLQGTQPLTNFFLRTPSDTTSCKWPQEPWLTLAEQSLLPTLHPGAAAHESPRTRSPHKLTRNIFTGEVWGCTRIYNLILGCDTQHQKWKAILYTRRGKTH